MDKIKKLRIIFIAIGIFVMVLGFFLYIFSTTRNVTYHNDNGFSLKELSFPYQLEGAIAVPIGSIVFRFGIDCDDSIKGKKIG